MKMFKNFRHFWPVIKTLWITTRIPNLVSRIPFDAIDSFVRMTAQLLISFPLDKIYWPLEQTTWKCDDRKILLHQSSNRLSIGDCDTLIGDHAQNFWDSSWDSQVIEGFYNRPKMAWTFSFMLRQLSKTKSPDSWDFTTRAKKQRSLCWQRSGAAFLIPVWDFGKNNWVFVQVGGSKKKVVRSAVLSPGGQCTKCK